MKNRAIWSQLGLCVFGLVLQYDLLTTADPWAAVCLWLYVVGVSLHYTYKAFTFMSKVGRGLALMPALFAGVALSSYLLAHPFHGYWVLMGFYLCAAALLSVVALEHFPLAGVAFAPYAIAFVAVPMVLCGLGISVPYSFGSYAILLAFGAGQVFVATECFTRASAAN